MVQGARLSTNRRTSTLQYHRLGHDDIANLLRCQLQKAASRLARLQHLDNNVARRLARHLQEGWSPRYQVGQAVMSACWLAARARACLYLMATVSGLPFVRFLQIPWQREGVV